MFDHEAHRMKTIEQLSSCLDRMSADQIKAHAIELAIVVAKQDQTIVAASKAGSQLRDLAETGRMWVSGVLGVLQQAGALDSAGRKRDARELYRSLSGLVEVMKGIEPPLINLPSEAFRTSDQIAPNLFCPKG